MLYNSLLIRPQCQLCRAILMQSCIAVISSELEFVVGNEKHLILTYHHQYPRNPKHAVTQAEMKTSISLNSVQLGIMLYLTKTTNWLLTQSFFMCVSVQCMTFPESLIQKNSQKNMHWYSVMIKKKKRPRIKVLYPKRHNIHTQKKENKPLISKYLTRTFFFFLLLFINFKLII